MLAFGIISHHPLSNAERPSHELAGAVVADVDAIVPVNVLDMFWSAAPFDIGRRRHGAHAIGRELARNEAGIFRAADPYRDIDAFLNEIGKRVADANVDGQPGIFLPEARQVRREDMDRDRSGRCDLDGAGRLAPRGHGDLFDLFRRLAEASRPGRADRVLQASE